MITPAEIEAMPLELESHFKELEIRIMDDIIRKLKANGGEITRATDWQIHRLYELGLSKKEIRSAIQSALDLSDSEIEHIYSDVISGGYARDESIYEALGKEFIPFEDNKTLQQLISSVKNQTKDEFKNITQSMGFAVRQSDGKLKFKPIADYYQDTLDKAMLDITSGAFDYNTVLKRTISEMTNSGLRTVDYASGWSNRVNVAVRRAIVTGFNQVVAKVNEDNAEKLGTNTFEISWHSGHRPSHWWGGQWFTKDKLVSVCGLGTPEGLCGCNCYHSYSAVIPGVSVPTYTEEQLKEMEAQEQEKKKYGDKEYTKYEALQRQRRLETTMRAQRQKIKLLQEGGADEDDIIAARCRYRGTSAEYSRFSKAMNLKQQRDRVTVDGLGNIGVGKWKLHKDNMSKPKVYTGKTWKKTGAKITKEQHSELVKYAKDKGVKLVSFENFDGDISLVRDVIDKAHEVICDFPELSPDNKPLQIHNSFQMADADFAHTINNKIFINDFAFRDRKLLAEEYAKKVAEKWFVDGTDYTSIIYHEMGHVVSNVYGLSPKRIASDLTGLKGQPLLDYITENLSVYAGYIPTGKEIISEVFSSVYSKGSNNKFALNYYSECVKIILKRGGAS